MTRPLTVDVDDLATPAMLAATLRVSRGAVSNYIARHSDFPRPVLAVGSARLYSRAAVVAWARRRDDDELARARAHLDAAQARVDRLTSRHA